jgi:hypothetical protein
MPKTVLSPPNAILFIFDPTNKEVVIPAYLDDELTAATATCVSVGTQADVDGETEVSLDIGGAVPLDLELVFSGAVAAPGGKVAVVTSQFQRALELNVPIGTVEIIIWADDAVNPGRIAINVKSIIGD